VDAVAEAWGELLASAAFRKWVGDSPQEWQRVQSYKRGGARPSLDSHFGRALVALVDAMRAAPAPPPPAPRSVFAGIGIWTAWEPGAAAMLPPNVEWVAFRPDLTTPTIARAVAGKRSLIVWEANTYTGQAAVDEYGAAGYIGQAEGPGQLAAVQALGPITVPKAIVGSGPWLPGWTALLECYFVDVPSDLGSGFPVLGVFEGFPLSNYLRSLGARRDFSAYLREGMTPADLDLLATL